MTSRQEVKQFAKEFQRDLEVFQREMLPEIKAEWKTEGALWMRIIAQYTAPNRGAGAGAFAEAGKKNNASILKAKKRVEANLQYIYFPVTRGGYDLQWVKANSRFYRHGNAMMRGNKYGGAQPLQKRAYETLLAEKPAHVGMLLSGWARAAAVFSRSGGAPGYTHPELPGSKSGSARMGGSKDDWHVVAENSVLAKYSARSRRIDLDIGENPPVSEQFFSMLARRKGRIEKALEKKAARAAKKLVKTISVVL